MSDRSSQTVIIQTQPRTRITDIAANMLRNAGFEVIESDSMEQVCREVNEHSPVLVVIRGNREQVAGGLDRLSVLPPEQRPSRIAILKDDESEDPCLSRKVPGTHVDVFVEPLQAFGLLNVVRRLRREVVTVSN